MVTHGVVDSHFIYNDKRTAMLEAYCNACKLFCVELYTPVEIRVL